MIIVAPRTGSNLRARHAPPHIDEVPVAVMTVSGGGMSPEQITWARHGNGLAIVILRNTKARKGNFIDASAIGVAVARSFSSFPVIKSSTCKASRVFRVRTTLEVSLREQTEKFQGTRPPFLP